jgi:hypothetical protein
MTVRLLRFRVLVVACALMTAVSAVALTCGSASAKTIHKYLGSFGSFSNIQGLAVDDSTGDVYVYEAGQESILKFNASGEPANFTATGTNVIEGVGRVGVNGDQQVAVDNSSGPAKGDIYVANGSNVKIYASSGKFLGELNEAVTSEVSGAPWGSPFGIAVDANGDVYVGLWYTYHINKYVPTTNPVTNRDYVSSLSGVVESVGPIAADSEGNVYAGDTVTHIFKYSPMEFGSLQANGTDFAPQGNVPAVDLSNNDVYLDNETEVLIYDSAGNQIEKIKPSSEDPSAFNNSWALAVNSATGAVYVGDREHGDAKMFGPAVVVPDVTTNAPTMTTTVATLNGTVNPDGIEASCYFEYGTSTSYGESVPCAASPGAGSSPVPVSAELSGLQPGTLYHARLVATNENGTTVGEDVTFALPFPPRITGEWATDVAITTARIDASIRPMSYETTFHVEYGTDTGYGSSIPVPDSDIGAVEKEVSQLLTGLQPNTTYHYRVVATNANGTVDGPDKTFTTFAVPQPTADSSCSNAAYRKGLSGRLPDCRAYEMVSPVAKNGADVNASSYKEFPAASSGERVQYATRTGLGDTKGSGLGGYTQFVATRGANGWATKAITPTPALNAPLQLFLGATLVMNFSEELDRTVLSGYDLPGTTGAPPNQQNYYLEDTSNARLLDTVTRFEGFEEEGPFFTTRWGLSQLGGGSADLGVVTFQMRVNLVSQATGLFTPKVYADNHGKVELVGYMPDGKVPSTGSELVRSRTGAIGYKDTVSRDGSRILFRSAGNGGQRELYMRKDATKTVLISESEASTPEVARNVNFQAATPDGTKVVFSTNTQLLDSDPGGPGVALYLYTDSDKPETDSNLTYIGRFAGENEGRPQGVTEGLVVKGMSADGSHIYFDSEYNPEALPFKTVGDGLFLWDNGQLRQVAPEPGAPEYGFSNNDEAVVTRDGQRIAFMNSYPLTRNDFTVAGGLSSMYLYDEATDKLTCVSCPPTGAKEMSGVELAASATSRTNPGFSTPIQPRFLSQDGRYVFFNTKEALVAQDVNKVTDAYEYNTETGKLSLLSPGTGETGTWFVEASADGGDVFLATRQQLTSGDPDKLVDLYDARIGGGFSEPPPSGPPCAGDACQGTPGAAPSFNTASEFNGQGNPTGSSVTKAKVKRLTQAQLLRRALAACRKKKGNRKRAACEKNVRRRYAGKRRSAKRAIRVGR